MTKDKAIECAKAYAAASEYTGTVLVTADENVFTKRDNSGVNFCVNHVKTTKSNGAFQKIHQLVIVDKDNVEYESEVTIEQLLKRETPPEELAKMKLAETTEVSEGAEGADVGGSGEDNGTEEEHEGEVNSVPGEASESEEALKTRTTEFMKQIAALEDSDKETAINESTDLEMLKALITRVGVSNKVKATAKARISTLEVK